MGRGEPPGADHQDHPGQVAQFLGSGDGTRAMKVDVTGTTVYLGNLLEKHVTKAMTTTCYCARG